MRPWLRLREVPAAALAFAMVTACASGGGTVRSAGPPQRQTAPAVSADPCRVPSGQVAGPLAGGRVVLGQVSVPAAVLDQPPVPVRSGMWRYWHKAPIAIRAGHQTVVVSVPSAWRHRAAITWGQGVGIVSTLRLPGCVLVPGSWNAYAGGFYLRSSSACIPLLFSVGRRTAILRFGVAVTASLGELAVDIRNGG